MLLRGEKKYINEGRKNLQENARRIPKSNHRVYFHNGDP